MRVLLVLPKSRLSFFGYSGLSKGFPHLGLAYLISVLKGSNVTVELFDAGTNEDRHTLAGNIEIFKPDLIGVTIYTPTRHFAYQTLSDIKKISDIPVVIGGPHISTFPKKVLEETMADFAVKHEGEYTLLELIEALAKKKKDLSQIKGLIWRDNNYIIENDDRPFIEDLDSLPFPDFGLFDIPAHPSYKRKVLPLITSRGCPFNCNFCAARLAIGRRFRPRSAQNVCDEILYHYRKGYTQFDFNDDCFSFDMQRANDILDKIIASKIDVKFQFLSGLRVDKINRQLLSKLKEAGCFYITYGCESGNAEILKEINKGITLEQVKTAVQLTKEAGIDNVVNFIVGHRNETYRKALDSISFAKSLNTLVNFGQLIPYPGTPAFDWAEKNGRFLVDKNTYFEIFTWESTEPIFETKEFSAKERKKILKKAFALHELMVLRLRFGMPLAYIIFLLTRNSLMKKILATFVLTNKFGNKIAVLLSKKSYK